MLKIIRFIILFLFSSIATKVFAQITVLDNATRIEIISFNSLRSMALDDTTNIRTLAGNAKVKQGNTILSGDSISINSRTNIAEVFGNVHINDADTVNTYADYLKYVGKERIAYLKRNVKLTDGKASLSTNDLEYNVATGVATYTGGGKVFNGSSVLTSTDAIYYSDTKDVYFKKQVHLIDPKYDIVADSLKYNTATKIANLITPTRIKTKDGKVIQSRNGTYNLQSGEAQFFDRTQFNDINTSAIANEMFFDEKTGVAILNGRAKFVDSLNHMIVIGNRIESNNKTNSFLATGKPVVIIVKDADSTYITADTLFSGLRKYDDSFSKKAMKKDTLKNIGIINANDKSVIKKEIILNKVPKDTITKLTSLDTNLLAKIKDSSNVKKEIIIDTASKELQQTAAALDNITADTSRKLYTKIDTVNNKQVYTKMPDDSIRYVLGFRNVRIYNDSSQAACDSMYYSTEDSVFRMFKNPIVWKEKNQITGDTMYLFTENQQPKRVYVFTNSMIINKQNAAMYNQAGGRSLNAYFKKGKIDYARIKGSPAETIFYAQDEDSAYIGMNRCSGDVVDVYFEKEEVYKIKYINSVDGTMFPMNQIPTDKRLLKNFSWQDKRRPKNKLEMFE
jgi:lipopolysaccharide export system protein LptA